MRCLRVATEQAIDIEAVHSTAPNAHILYVGAQDCFDNGLFTAEQNVIDNGLANVVTQLVGRTRPATCSTTQRPRPPMTTSSCSAARRG